MFRILINIHLKCEFLSRVCVRIMSVIHKLCSLQSFFSSFQQNLIRIFCLLISSFDFMNGMELHLTKCQI